MDDIGGGLFGIGDLVHIWDDGLGYWDGSNMWRVVDVSLKPYEVGKGIGCLLRYRKRVAL